jgi:hypothetical protein
LFGFGGTTLSHHLADAIISLLGDGPTTAQYGPMDGPRLPPGWRASSVRRRTGSGGYARTRARWHNLRTTLSDSRAKRCRAKPTRRPSGVPRRVWAGGPAIREAREPALMAEA